jgi:hypothetical protein
MIEGWWAICEDDEEWSSLSEDLRSELTRSEGPENSPNESRYDALVFLALLDRTAGVTNRWLSEQLNTRTGQRVEVDGPVEPMNQCVCCGRLSMRPGGEWDVCPACYWEDDGTSDVDMISSANRMTLRDARRSIAEFGASSPEAVRFVVGDDRYQRTQSDDKSYEVKTGGSEPH